MLESVKEYAPELFTFILSAYEQPSLLLYGDQILESSEGVQQGDSLGPLLFCLAIQPLIVKLQSEFSVFYLDDGNIGGCVEDVMHDLQLVEEEPGLVGLLLNHRKTELICDVASTRDTVLSVVSELRVNTCGQATLLGTPVGSVGTIDATITSEAEKLKLRERDYNIYPAKTPLYSFGIRLLSLKSSISSALHPAFSLSNWRLLMGPLGVY